MLKRNHIERQGKTKIKGQSKVKEKFNIKWNSKSAKLKWISPWPSAATSVMEMQRLVYKNIRIFHWQFSATIYKC